MNSSKDSYWANNASKYGKNTNKDIKSLLRRIQGDIGHANRVLDVAAGTGNVSLFLAKYVQHVDCLDIESKMIAVAREKAEKAKIENISFHVQSAYELNFPDAVFDVVVILNSLHVMDTPRSALNEARRVIKPKGLIFVPTYCHAETKRGLDNYRKWSLKSGHKSYHLFSIDILCELVSNCGFEIKKKDIIEINHGRETGVMILGYIVASPS